MRITRLQIGELAALLGITPKAVRHYHQIGLLDEPPRSEKGYRLYGMDHLERLQHIQRLTRMGLSLRQIGFILSADAPDALLTDLLQQRQSVLTEEIARLQAEHSRIAAFLESGSNAATGDPPPHSAMHILHTVIQPGSATLADTLLMVEGEALARIDALRWSGDYTAFWEQVAMQIRQVLRHDEHTFILWMERYLALAGMTHDDRQASAWLADLHEGAGIVRRSFQLEPNAMLSSDEQLQIQRLIALALFDQATPLQREFLRVVLRVP